MPLPKIEYPLYPIYIKSLDREVKFRPFLVKEEKILLMAKEAKDADSARLAINQIITNCAQEPLDVDSLPLFDIEMIFLKLRAKSVGESVRLTFNCRNEVDGQVCNADTDYSLDLNKVKYEIPEGHDSKIMLTSTLGMKLKYPTLDLNLGLLDDDDEYTAFLSTLLSLIEYVFDENSVYQIQDVPPEDMQEWLSNMSLETMERIKKFFSTAPKAVLEDTVKCSKCGFEHTIRSENLLDFFL